MTNLPKSDNAKEKRCDHEWDQEISSMYNSEYFVQVKCKKCGVYGEEDVRTGKVSWPCT